MNSQSEPSSRSQYLVFTVQETTVVTLTMLLPPIISRQRAGSRHCPHTREGGSSWQTYRARGRITAQSQKEISVNETTRIVDEVDIYEEGACSRWIPAGWPKLRTQRKRVGARKGRTWRQRLARETGISGGIHVSIRRLSRRKCGFVKVVKPVCTMPAEMEIERNSIQLALLCIEYRMRFSKSK
jgi:hypothetical protein